MLQLARSKDLYVTYLVKRMNSGWRVGLMSSDYVGEAFWARRKLFSANGITMIE